MRTRRLGSQGLEVSERYQHRVDSDVPIEETVGAMAGLVEQGKPDRRSGTGQRP